ncbi:hypothetical protein STRCI_004731 [Streptomyces cinnabarinus]|uniref:Uncharacterized protein n=1 Tax=Streptomyces cinnabarinus TaxID=67287 RepID=A0ABY7KIK7_9ACTN|nr:hypothetical protein [Streptomyces cinnabarinus]WAZ23390.1 hypothetical protein STRCI_004731 [Streptomyces cinnabarinus]
MTERHAPISETGLAYDVFAPLWGILELAAVTASGMRPLRDVSLADFVGAHRGEVDGILETVRGIGDFSADTMSIFERQGGWNDGREVTPEYLMMYSGCIEGYPPDTDDPVVLRRMVRMGGDLQTAALMNALVGTATVRGPGLAEAPGLVLEAVRGAGALLGGDGEQVVRDAFRMWRVAHLPGVLRPDAPAPPAVKDRLRAYAHALESLIDDD